MHPHPYRNELVYTLQIEIFYKHCNFYNNASKNSGYKCLDMKYNLKYNYNVCVLVCTYFCTSTSYVPTCAISMILAHPKSIQYLGVRNVFV